MPARHLYFIMTNTWNRLALLIFAVLSLLVAGELQAGVVVGGTRFIFPADKESIAILLTNTSQESWLINRFCFVVGLYFKATLIEPEDHPLQTCN